MKLKSKLSLLALLMTQNPVDAHNQINAASFKSIANEAYQMIADDEKINALSVGVYFQGEKYSAHFGELDVDQGNRPDDETIYELASVSKALTGLLVAQAVVDEKVSLDDAINTYLSAEFSHFNFHANAVTIRHLLTHTSGLPKFLPVEINDLFTEFNESLPFRMSAVQEKYSKDAFFKDLKALELSEKPGTNYSYSNVDTELMAHILEQLYNKPFNEILTEYFFNQADMKNTAVLLNKKQMANYANGYGMTNKIVPHESVNLFGADGGIKSTTADMLNFMQLQLSHNKPAVVESHQVLFADGNKQMAYYWPIKNKDSYGQYFRHHGASFGFQNWLLILPEHDLGLFVITNQSDLDTADKLMGLAEKIINKIIGVSRDKSDDNPQVTLFIPPVPS